MKICSPSLQAGPDSSTDDPFRFQCARAQKHPQTTHCSFHGRGQKLQTGINNLAADLRSAARKVEPLNSPAPFAVASTSIAGRTTAGFPQPDVHPADGLAVLRVGPGNPSTGHPEVSIANLSGTSCHLQSDIRINRTPLAQEISIDPGQAVLKSGRVGHQSPTQNCRGTRHISQRSGQKTCRQGFTRADRQAALGRCGNDFAGSRPRLTSGANTTRLRLTSRTNRLNATSSTHSLSLPVSMPG